MAEEQVASEQEQAPAAKPGRKKILLIGGILLAVMTVEAVVVLVMVKHFSPPPQQASAHAVEGLDTHAAAKAAKDVEIMVAQLRVPNEKTGARVFYDLVVCASVSEADKEKFNALVEEKKYKIQDRLNGIIRECDPQDFKQTSLEALRKQLHNVLSEIIEDEKMIREILIPKLTPMGE